MKIENEREREREGGRVNINESEREKEKREREWMVGKRNKRLSERKRGDEVNVYI